MNPHLPTPWLPYHVIEVGDQKFKIFSRIEFEDDFLSRMRFMLVFPGGKKRMLALAASKHAVQDYSTHFGAGSHEKLVRETVIAQATEEIKADVKAFFHAQPQPDVKLVPLDMENPIHVGVDFSKVEAQMMAQVFHPQPSPSGAVYGPSILSGSVIKLAKAQKAMEDAFKKLASGFVKAGVVWDSFAGMSKTEAFKTLYGGGQQEALTPTGLATLKRFNVALVG